MTEKKIAKKQLKVANLVSSITRIEGFLATYNEERDASELQTRLERLDQQFELFEVFQGEYEELIENPESLKQSSDLRAKVEEQYLRVKGGLLSKLARIKPNPVPTNQPITSANLQNHVKLPSVQLPQFNGDLNEWIAFHDTFVALIHTSTEIHSVQKLQYLRASLKGEALRVIESLPISAQNYPIAWDALLKRYQQKGLLKRKHLQGLTAPPKAVAKPNVALRSLVEDFDRHVNILEQLGEPVHQWGSLLIHLLTSKLDARTFRDWEEHCGEDPQYAQLIEFLHKKIRTNELLEMASIKHVPIQKQPSSGTKLTAHVATEKRQTCPSCGEGHPLTKCSSFENMNTQERWNLVQSKKLCSNCLHQDHFARNCPSKYNCRTCGKRHHSGLHSGVENKSTGPKGPDTTRFQQGDVEPQEGASVKKSQQENATTSFVTHATTQCANIFLSTVVLIIVDKFGREHLGRALLDSASQANLISERLSQILRLPARKIDAHITGVNSSNTRVTKSVCTHIRSRATKMSLPMEFLVVNKVTNQLPASTVNTVNWKLPPELKLADPNFNVSGDIDLLLGAEHYYKFIKNGRIELGPQLPTLVESEFGWLFSGKAEISTNTISIKCHVHTIEPSIEDQLEKFWALEEVQSNNYSPEEKQCEEIYQTTTFRNEEGRYIVTLPKHPDFKEKLGESKAGALRRFHQLEKKLLNNVDMKKQYDEFLQEYLALGHMVLDDSTNDEIECYLPHHAVFKESSTTTKVRVVFDGSAKTSTGRSLNDLLLVGPVVQQDLLAIITRFRKHRIALSADAEKMYRQVLTADSDSALQKILYRFKREEPIQTYRLKTVTYGLAPSSFLATRTLLQLAEDEGNNYPLAKRALQKDFYIDDGITGADSVEQALQLRTELSVLLKKGGFTLRKWCSNSLKVLEGLPPDQVATQSTIAFQNGECIQTLGIFWEPALDTFTIAVNINHKNENLTKRRILSQIAQLFDPLGLIAPVIIQAKFLMQQIWICALDWDDPVPPLIESKWRTICQQLPLLKDLKIERYAFLPNSTVEMHCFVDASMLGYGASIYCRSETSNGTIKVRLIAAKSRVAPLKQITLPRLELCAALLGARLYEKIAPALEMKFQNVIFWSDSTVVLHWLKASPHQWKTFVANRVSEIQATTHGAKWFHIDGLENPADLVSRGLFPEEIIHNKKWFEGPEWLIKPKECWPYAHQPHGLPTDVDLETKQTTLAVQANTAKLEANPLLIRFSSYNKMVNVITYCLRFINNCRTKTGKIQNTLLSVDERCNTIHTLVKITQSEVFSEELKHLKRGKPVPRSSHLKLISPFLDDEGLIRVGGRLNLSREADSVKHPLILPGFHHFTKLLLTHQHRKLLHAGTALVLATVRDEFWPINGRRAIRSVIRNCYKCTRANPKPMNQPVGQLPTSRTTPSRPFFNTGIDYCGPLFIKPGQRKASLIKAYIAIFVCFSTKAVHIELVGNLSTATFISALRRFIARRGLPRHIYSDNGTNFIGAKNELHSVYQMLNSKDEVQINNYLTSEGITWHLIPPRAPNFGGLWEAAVKVAKTHLLRQIGSVSLSYEDLVTLLAQIEACMNSRPLTALTEDSNDFEALTPGHFLVGSSLQSLPEMDVRNIPTNRLNQFQLIQQKVQHFWDRWRKEYLRELHRQATINPARSQIKIGQLVILEDDLLPPCRWPLARIEAMHPGPDGICRVVTLRTASGVFKRPISKICCIPSAEEDHSQETKD